MNQLERMTLGTQDLATRNKQSIIFRYDLKSNLISNFQQTNKIIMRKVYKTITLPIYYSLYHDKNVTVNTLLYAQLLYEIISF
jgi:hypothetical protein